jgi:chemotaxis protein MotB
MRRLILLAAFAALFLGSCVTARQYEELETRKNDIETENTQLKRSNESLTAENTELNASVSDLQKRVDALSGDTTLLGTSLRHLRGQYDKINELNEILMGKNTQMLNEMNAENRQLLADLQSTRTELLAKEDVLRVLEAELNEKEANLESVSAELRTREQRVNELEDLLAKQEASANALRDKIQQALLGFKDKGLTVETRNGKVYVSLEAKLLFPSGSTVINAEGKQALVDLAKAIEDQADMEIIVEGHTDTDALRSTSIPRDNWELSVLRATAVVKIMTENSSIQPAILAASGRSEYHPVDAEDKARNRRIEVIISPNLNDLFQIIENNN